MEPPEATVWERFALIVNGPALLGAVISGLELGIFGFLARVPGAGFEEIRRTVDIPEHQLRVLLHALCATKLIRREGEIYRQTETASSLLAEQGEDWLTILLAWQRIYYPAFVHLTAALRAATNVALADLPGSEPTLYARLRHAPQQQTMFNAAMSAFTRQSLDGLVEQQLFSELGHVLDIGGGDATTANALLARWPGLAATVFDKYAKATAQEQGERLTVVSGDLFDDPFPTGANAILFSHVLEIFAPAEITQLLAKAFVALPPGGRVIIYGFNVDEEETSGVFSARLSLYLNVLASGSGFAYPLSEYARCATKAGFSVQERVEGLPFEHGLLIARRD